MYIQCYSYNALKLVAIYLQPPTAHVHCEYKPVSLCQRNSSA